MLKTSFILTSKKPLTHDVYELVYSCPDMEKDIPKPGQYVLFQLAPGLNRAYSLAHFQWTSFTLIIKRIADGRGSPIICDADIGTVFSGMISLGHFTLRENSRNKCFIWTGTGFAPLYCQVLASAMILDKPGKVAFVFGVRSLVDAFYHREVSDIWAGFSDFEYVRYFSRESDLASLVPPGSSHDQSGYVTDWITSDNIWQYQEFYICGSPAMVKSAREKLELLGVSSSDIFFEQF